MVKEKEKEMNLDELGKAIKVLFDAGKEDEEIAASVKKTVIEVGMIRKLLGLFRKRWAIFDSWKKVAKDEAAEKFVIWKISIPDDKAKEIGLVWGEDYDFLPSCSKGELCLQFRERPK